MKKVIIGIGSNIGDRLTYIKKAIQWLDTHKQIEIQQISSIYETEPVGYVNQNSFLNLVVQIYTNLTPYELLSVTQNIEQQLGREREIHWGPRTIDLDILFYNNENINSENLIIPHPRIGERGFVVIPLEELGSQDEEVRVWLEKTVQTNLEREGVVVWKRRSGGDVFELFGS